MGESGTREVAHMADWELEVWAENLPDLFCQSARGMYAMSGIRLAERGRRARRTLALEAPEPERLLVRFLSELLHFAESKRVAFDEVALTLSEAANGASLGLSAVLSGRKIVAQDKEIKAVTFHNLLIRKTAGGFAVNIVFDV